jgi:hypothetical protein
MGSVVATAQPSAGRSPALTPAGETLVAMAALGARGGYLNKVISEIWAVSLFGGSLTIQTR